MAKDRMDHAACRHEGRRGLGAALLLAALAALPVSRTKASGVQWQSDLKNAAREAERSQKPLLLKFTAPWCGYCRKMQQTTFQNDRLAAQINDCFVPVVVDADEHKDLLKALGVRVLPTSVVISPKFTVMKRITGYRTAQQFTRDLSGLCAPPPAQRRKPTFALASQTRVVPDRTERPSATSTQTPSWSDDRDGIRRSTAPFPTAEVRPKQPERRPVSKQTPRANARPASTAARRSVQRPIAAERAAFGGYCLVSMLVDRRVRKGSPRHVSYFREHRLQFASAEFKQLFDADPRRYWPVDGGTCPVTMQEEQVLKDGSPHAPVIYHGKLWLCASREHRRRFSADPAKYAATLTAARR